MNRPNLRRNLFIVSSIVLTLTLVFSLWRHASAEQTKADGDTAARLTQLCAGIGKVDSTSVDQILKLAIALDSCNPQHEGWLTERNIQNVGGNVSQLARNLEYLQSQLKALSENDIKAKTAALPDLTAGCLAAVNSATEASRSLNEPVRQLRESLEAIKSQLGSTRSEIAAYRQQLIDASRTPHESLINDLPLNPLFGTSIASIGSGTETYDQSQDGDVYRRILTETSTVDWMRLDGDHLVGGIEILGMDIIVRSFAEDENACKTQLIRFSHGERIKILDGQQRLIVLYCKPETAKPQGWARNTVRFVGKQIIICPPAPATTRGQR